MFRANGATRSFPLAREITVIGRREDCDLRIPLTEVSRKHCRLVIGGDNVRIEDLGSSNGTLVNGQRIQESTLNPGDYLQVGPVVFAVQVNGEPAESDIVPAVPPQAVAGPGDSHPPAAPEQETMQPSSGLAALDDDADLVQDLADEPVQRPSAPVADPDPIAADDDDVAALPTEQEDQGIIIDDAAAEREEAVDDDIIDLDDNKR